MHQCMESPWPTAWQGLALSGHYPRPQAFNNTYLFYGAYWAGPESSSAYSIRLAYLLSPLACLLLCFCGTLRR